MQSKVTVRVCKVGRLFSGVVNFVDVHVGGRVRFCRILLGMS